MERQVALLLVLSKLIEKRNKFLLVKAIPYPKKELVVLLGLAKPKLYCNLRLNSQSSLDRLNHRAI